MRSLLAVFVCIALGAPSAAAADDAETLFDRGVEAYRDKRFADAADWFRQAYEADPRADYLFSWAQSQRFGGDCARALQLYDQMLGMELADNQREAVIGSQKACEQDTDTVTPPGPETREPARSVTSRPGRTVPVVLWVAGGVGMTVGTGLLVSAQGKEDDADRATSYGDVDDAVGSARARRIAGWVTMSAGVILVGTGVALFVRDGPGERESTAFAPWLGRESVGVSVRARF